MTLLFLRAAVDYDYRLANHQSNRDMRNKLLATTRYCRPLYIHIQSSQKILKSSMSFYEGAVIADDYMHRKTHQYFMMLIRGIISNTILFRFVLLTNDNFIVIICTNTAL